MLLRGHCNSTICEEVHWCHIIPRMTYACWEQAPSIHTSVLTFATLDEGRCGTCHHIISRYRCSECCGTRGVAAWTGTYETSAIGREGGGVFMHGGRWICLLREVAQGMGLSNAAAALEPPPPPPLPPSPPPLPSPPPKSQWNEYTFPMPEEYNMY